MLSKYEVKSMGIILGSFIIHVMTKVTHLQ